MSPVELAVVLDTATEQQSVTLAGDIAQKLHLDNGFTDWRHVLEQLKLGTVHLYPEGSTYMNKWVPEIKFISSAFLFDDRDHWVRFMNSDMVKDWYAKIKSRPAFRSLLADQLPGFPQPEHYADLDF